MKRSLLFLLMGLLVASLVSFSCSPPPPQEITVATNAAYPPFTYIDEQTGETVGFDIDLMNAIAQVENLKVDYVEVEFQPLMEGMAQGKYDAAISAITITEERKKDMLFTDPYFITGQVVTVGKDNTTITGKDDLAGKVVGVETASTGASSISKIQGITVKDYADLKAAFNDLMNGTINAVVCDMTVASYYVEKYPDKLKIAGERFTTEYYGIAVNKNKPELLDKINAGLFAVTRAGLIRDLSYKWLHIQPVGP
jgi:polar amino acid transport system substrate-binding protein